MKLRDQGPGGSNVSNANLLIWLNQDYVEHCLKMNKTKSFNGWFAIINTQHFKLWDPLGKNMCWNLLCPFSALPSDGLSKHLTPVLTEDVTGSASSPGHHYQLTVVRGSSISLLVNSTDPSVQCFWQSSYFEINEVIVSSGYHYSNP